jgi:hypothetical protein
VRDPPVGVPSVVTEFSDEPQMTRVSPELAVTATDLGVVVVLNPVVKVALGAGMSSDLPAPRYCCFSASLTRSA